MAHCRDCGAPKTTGVEACRRCGARRAVADGGTPSGEAGDGSARDEYVEHDTISRRAILGYTGGSALATLGVAGAGWFAFIYESLEPEEKLVREYFDAIDRDHYNTAALLFHEDSPDEPWAADRVTEVTQMDISVEDTEIADRWENAERESVEEWALVVADVEMDSGFESETFAIGILVAKNTEGEWRIWRDDEEESAALG